MSASVQFGSASHSLGAGQSLTLQAGLVDPPTSLANLEAVLLFNPAALKLESIDPAPGVHAVSRAATYPTGIVGLSFSFSGPASAHMPLASFKFTVVATEGVASQVGLNQVYANRGTVAVASASTSIYIKLNPLAIATTSLPPASTNLPYMAGLQATGGIPPYLWTALNAPAGLAVQAGFLAGQPSALGTFQLEVNVSDSDVPQARATVSLPFAVAQGTLTFPAGQSLPTAYVGQTYTATLAGTGGAPPYQWILDSGTIPEGLVLQPNGTISGIPTVPGSQELWLVIYDSAGGFTLGLVLLDVRVFTGIEQFGACPDGQLLATVANAVPQPMDITVSFGPGATSQFWVAVFIDNIVLYEGGAFTNASLQLSPMLLVGGPRTLRISQIGSDPAGTQGLVLSLSIATSTGHDRPGAAFNRRYVSGASPGHNLRSDLVEFLVMPGSGDDLSLVRQSAVEFVAIRSDGTPGRASAYWLQGCSSVGPRLPTCGIGSQLAAFGTDPTQWLTIAQRSDGAWFGSVQTLPLTPDAVALQEPGNLLVANDNAITTLEPDGSSFSVALPPRIGTDPIAAIASVPQVPTVPLATPDALFALSAYRGRLDAVNLSASAQSMATGAAGATMDWTFTENDKFSTAVLLVSNPQAQTLSRIVAIPGAMAPFLVNGVMDIPPADRVAIATLIPGGDWGAFAFNRQAGLVAAGPSFSSAATDVWSAGAFLSEALVRTTAGQLAVYLLQQDGTVNCLGTQGVGPAACFAVEAYSGSAAPYQYIPTACRVLVGNQGVAPLIISRIRADGDIAFQCRSQPTLPSTLATGDAVAIDIAFTGEPAGTYGGRLLIETNDPLHPVLIAPLSVTVTGNNVGVSGMTHPLDIQPLAPVTEGGPAFAGQWDVDVANYWLSASVVGTAMVGPDQDLFSFPNPVPTGTLSAATVSIPIQCNPTRGGWLKAIAIVTVEVGGVQFQSATPLRVYSKPTLQPRVSGGGPLACGDASVGQSVSASASVSNTGAADLEIQYAAFSGPGAVWFSLVSAVPATVAPGQSTTLQVVFSPDAQALNPSATLTLQTNAGFISFFLTGAVV